MHKKSIKYSIRGLLNDRKGLENVGNQCFTGQRKVVGFVYTYNFKFSFSDGSSMTGLLPSLSVEAFKGFTDLLLECFTLVLGSQQSVHCFLIIRTLLQYHNYNHQKTMSLLYNKLTLVLGLRHGQQQFILSTGPKLFTKHVCIRCILYIIL